MKKVIMAVAGFVLGCAAVMSGAHATNQSVPAQAMLDSQVRFGNHSVDLTHARVVDIANGNQKITDANGVTRTGYFYGQYVFANHPAFKQYIRAYAGSSIFYNASMFTSADCVNGATRLTWINGGVTDVVDGCSLQQIIMNYSRVQ